MICVTFVLAYGIFRLMPIFTDENTTITMNTILLSSRNQFFNSYNPAWGKGMTIAPNVTFAFGIGDEIIDP